MQIILHLENKQLVITYPGSRLEDALANIEDPYLILQVEGLPDAPRSAWIVDWDAGSVSVDPGYVEPQPPNWDGLTAVMLLNAEWLAATNIVRGINPGITEGLGSAMTQLSSSQYNQFAFLFNQICTIAEVPQSQREAWAVIGEGCNMPTEFLDIVRGVGNGE
jgi:hypothetical protein